MQLASFGVRVRVEVGVRVRGITRGVFHAARLQHGVRGAAQDEGGEDNDGERGCLDYLNPEPPPNPRGELHREGVPVSGENNGRLLEL